MINSKLQVTAGSASDKGSKPQNEDFFGVSIPEDPLLTRKGITAAIADGMSGSDAGKTASHCCIAGFLCDYYSTPDSWSVLHAGQKILSATNSWLYSQGQKRYQSEKGLASTLSILILKSNTAHIFHIGDTRIYRFRQGDLEQLTRDHRIWLSGQKHYLNRAMGIEPRLEVDYKAFPLEENDLFLMTTDGVHDFVDEKSIKAKLTDTGINLERCAADIIGQAVANASDDNLTCQIIRVESLPLANDSEYLLHHINLPFPPPLEPGMTLDGYRIEAELHASKRTQIYRAFDTHTKTRVILKTPSVLFEDDTHYIEHFLHEEWAGKRISHHNVLKIFSSDRKKTAIYYVTEYIEGVTLREWMDNNPKPDIKEVRKIAEQITKGLRAFHRMEMLHQDLKPENIMIDRNNRIKIIDFGSVKIAGIAEITPLDRSKQENENVLSPLNYTAPEYHLGQRGSIGSDLFSLAVIVYEMLNGALPFGEQLPEKPTRININKLQYIPSFHHNPMVPVWIDKALKKATSPNPLSRYDDIFEFLHDLSTPNKEFLKGDEARPLIDKNPMLFWKSLAGILALSNLITIYLLTL